MPPRGDGSKEHPWTLVQRRKRHPTVLIPRPGLSPLLLSANEAEELKVIIWSRSLPPRARILWTFPTIRDNKHLIAKARLYGRRNARRIELFALTKEARYDLLLTLRKQPLGLADEVCKAGRPYELRSRGRAKAAATVDTQQGRQCINRFDILADFHDTQPGDLSFANTGDGQVPDNTHPSPTDTEWRGSPSADDDTQEPAMCLTTPTRTECQTAVVASPSSQDHLECSNPTDCHLRLATLNVNGDWAASPSWGAELNRHRIEMVGVTETYLGAHAATPSIPGYVFLGRNMPEGTRRGLVVEADGHGVGLLLAEPFTQFVFPSPQQPRFRDAFWVQISHKTVHSVKSTCGTSLPVAPRQDLWIGIYYLSPSLPKTTLQQAAEEMEEFIASGREHGAEVVLMGDLNVDLPRALLAECTPSHREDVLRSVFSNTQLSSLHELSTERIDTFHRKGEGCSMLDYILVPHHSLAHWTVPVAHTEWDSGSDHWMLSTTCESFWQPSASATASTPVPDIWKGLNPRPRWRRKPINPPKGMESKPPPSTLDEVFGRRIDAILPLDADVARSYDAWSKELQDSIKETHGLAGPINRRKLPVWYNDEAREAIRERRKTYRSVRRARASSRTEEVIAAKWQNYLNARQRVKIVVLQAKAKYWQETMDKLNGPDLSLDARARLLRSLSSAPKRKQWGPVRDTSGRLITPGEGNYLETWADYYEGLGKSAPGKTRASLENQLVVEQALGEADFFSDPAEPSPQLLALNANILLEEVEKAQRKLPANKAPGLDSFMNEHLKGLSSILPMVQTIWNAGEVPEEWKTAMVCPLPKDGDPTVLDNSRGISLMSSVSKLFGKILTSRLSGFLDSQGILCPEQAGFRPGRECPEHCIVLYETLCRRRRCKQDTYLAFVDFSKAFDRVWRNGLLFKLHQIGVRGRMLRMLRGLYTGNKATLRVNGLLTRFFEVSEGVKQGASESPLLFITYVNDLLLELKKARIGVAIPGAPERQNPWSPLELLAALMWADDLVILAPTQQNLQKGLDILGNWCQRWRMCVNTVKTQVMIVRGTPAEAQSSAPELLVGHQPLQVVSRYKYLGVTFSDDLTWDSEISLRAEKVDRCVSQWTRVLRNPRILPQIRLDIIRTFILPVATYGIELWGSSWESCIPLENSISRAERNVTWLYAARVNRSMLAWELGRPPLRLVALQKLARLFVKWSNIDSSLMGSFVWPRRLLQSFQEHKHPDWMRIALRSLQHFGVASSKIRDRLPDGESVRQFTNSVKHTLLHTAARQHYITILSRPSDTTANHSRFLMLRRDDGELIQQGEFLKVPAETSGVSTLLRLRMGALRLNDVSTHWMERSKFCANPACCEVVETPAHFLLECPAYDSDRKIWVASWKRHSGGRFLWPKLVPGVPCSLDACHSLLVACPSFLDELSPGHRSEALRSRNKALEQMWLRRIRLNGANCTGSKCNPRVEANGMTQQNATAG